MTGLVPCGRPAALGGQIFGDVVGPVPVDAAAPTASIVEVGPLHAGRQRLDRNLLVRLAGDVFHRVLEVDALAVGEGHDIAVRDDDRVGDLPGLLNPGDVAQPEAAFGLGGQQDRIEEMLQVERQKGGEGDGSGMGLSGGNRD